MHRLSNIQLTLSDMIDIVADRTLPYSSVTAAGAIEANPPNYDPMDLSNISAEVNTIDGTTQCHRCRGIGHIARQCGTRSNPNRAAQYRSHQENQGRDNWRRDATKSTVYKKFSNKRQDITPRENTRKGSRGTHPGGH